MEALSKELGAEGFKQLEQELEGDWDEEGFDRIVQRIVGADADAGDDEVRVPDLFPDAPAATDIKRLQDDEKPTWGDDIDTAYAEEDDEDEMYDNDGDHAEGYEDEFAEAAGDEEMEVAEEAYEEEDGPINMVSLKSLDERLPALILVVSPGCRLHCYPGRKQTQKPQG